MIWRMGILWDYTFVVWVYGLLVPMEHPYKFSTMWFSRMGNHWNFGKVPIRFKKNPT